jgi:hypothetical protein
MEAAKRPKITPKDASYPCPFDTWFEKTRQLTSM